MAYTYISTFKRNILAEILYLFLYNVILVCSVADKQACKKGRTVGLAVSDGCRQLGIEFDGLVRHTSRSIQRPVACSDVVIVNQMNRALKYMDCILVNPAIPIAFVKLLTV